MGVVVNSLELLFTGAIHKGDGDDYIDAVGFGGDIYAGGGNDTIVAAAFVLTVHTGSGNDIVWAGAAALYVRDDEGDLVVNGLAAFIDIDKRKNGNVRFNGAAGAVNIHHSGLYGDIIYSGAAAANFLRLDGHAGSIKFSGGAGYNSLINTAKRGDINFNGVGLQNSVDRQGGLGSNGNVNFYGMGANNVINHGTQHGNSTITGAGLGLFVTRHANGHYDRSSGNVTATAVAAGAYFANKLMHGNMSITAVGLGIVVDREGSGGLIGQWEFRFVDEFYFKFVDFGAGAIPVLAARKVWREVAVSKTWGYGVSTGNVIVRGGALAIVVNHNTTRGNTDVVAAGGLNMITRGWQGDYDLSRGNVTVRLAGITNIVKNRVKHGNINAVMLAAGNYILRQGAQGGDSSGNVTAAIVGAANTVIHHTHTGNMHVTGIGGGNFIHRWSQGDFNHSRGNVTVDMLFGMVNLVNHATGHGNLNVTMLGGAHLVTRTGLSGHLDATLAGALNVVTHRTDFGDSHLEAVGGSNTLYRVARGDHTGSSGHVVAIFGFGIANVVDHTTAHGNTRVEGFGGANIITRRGTTGNVTARVGGGANIINHHINNGNTDVEAGGLYNEVTHVSYNGNFRFHGGALGNNLSYTTDHGNADVYAVGGGNHFERNRRTANANQTGHTELTLAGGANIANINGGISVKAYMYAGYNKLSTDVSGLTTAVLVGVGNEANITGQANITAYGAMNVIDTGWHADTITTYGVANVITTRGQQNEINAYGAFSYVNRIVADHEVAPAARELADNQRIFRRSAATVAGTATGTGVASAAAEEGAQLTADSTDGPATDMQNSADDAPDGLEDTTDSADSAADTAASVADTVGDAVADGAEVVWDETKEIAADLAELGLEGVEALGDGFTDFAASHGVQALTGALGEFGEGVTSVGDTITGALDTTSEYTDGLVSTDNLFKLLNVTMGNGLDVGSTNGMNLALKTLGFDTNQIGDKDEMTLDVNTALTAGADELGIDIDGMVGDLGHSVADFVTGGIDIPEIPTSMQDVQQLIADAISMKNLIADSADSEDTLEALGVSKGAKTDKDSLLAGREDAMALEGTTVDSAQEGQQARQDAGETGGSGNVGPIVLDMNNNNQLDLVGMGSNSVGYDFGDGKGAVKTAWTGEGENIDGFLTRRESDGSHTIRFAETDDETDMEGLSRTRNDNTLNNADSDYGDYGVWRDHDQDGEVDVGEYETLADLNINSIDLSGDRDAVQDIVAGSTVFRQTSASGNGGPRTVYDVGLQTLEIDAGLAARAASIARRTNPAARSGPMEPDIHVTDQDGLVNAGAGGGLRVGTFTFSAGLANILRFGHEDDVVLAIAAVNAIWGGDGNDTIISLGLGNYIEGGAGDDDAWMLGLVNYFDGGAGNDKAIQLGLANVARMGAGEQDFAIQAGKLNVTTKEGDGDLTAVMLGMLNVLYQGPGIGGDTHVDGNLLAIMVGVLNVAHKQGHGNAFGIMVAALQTFSHVGNGSYTAIMAGRMNVATKVGNGSFTVVMGGQINVATQVGDGEAIAVIGGIFNVITSVGNGNLFGFFGGRANVVTKVGNGTVGIAMAGIANLATIINQDSSDLWIALAGRYNTVTKVGDGDTHVIGYGSEFNIVSHVGNGRFVGAVMGRSNVLTKIGDTQDVVVMATVGTNNISTHVGDGTTIFVGFGRENIATKVGDGMTISAMVGRGNVTTHVGDGALLGLGFALGKFGKKRQTSVRDRFSADAEELLGGIGSTLKKTGSNLLHANKISSYSNIKEQAKKAGSFVLEISALGSQVPSLGLPSTPTSSVNAANNHAEPPKSTGVSSFMSAMDKTLASFVSATKKDWNDVAGFDDSWDAKLNFQANVTTKVGNGDVIFAQITDPSEEARKGNTKINETLHNSKIQLDAPGNMNFNALTQIGNGKTYTIQIGSNNIVTKVGHGDAGDGLIPDHPDVPDVVNISYGNNNVAIEINHESILQDAGNTWGEHPVSDDLGSKATNTIMAQLGRGNLNAMIKIGDGAFFGAAWHAATTEDGFWKNLYSVTSKKHESYKSFYSLKKRIRLVKDRHGNPILYDDPNWVGENQQYVVEYKRGEAWNNRFESDPGFNIEETQVLNGDIVSDDSLRVVKKSQLLADPNISHADKFLINPNYVVPSADQNAQQQPDKGKSEKIWQQIGAGGNIIAHIGKGDTNLAAVGMTNLGVKVGDGDVRSLFVGSNSIMIRVGDGSAAKTIDYQDGGEVRTDEHSTSPFDLQNGWDLNYQITVGNRNLVFNQGFSNDFIVAIQPSARPMIHLNPFYRGQFLFGGGQREADGSNKYGDGKWRLFSGIFGTSLASMFTGSGSFGNRLNDNFGWGSHETRSKHNTEWRIKNQDSKGLAQGYWATYKTQLQNRGKELWANFKRSVSEGGDFFLQGNFVVGGNGADVIAVYGDSNVVFGDTMAGILDLDLRAFFHMKSTIISFNDLLPGPVGAMAGRLGIWTGGFLPSLEIGELTGIESAEDGSLNTENAGERAEQKWKDEAVNNTFWAEVDNPLVGGITNVVSPFFQLGKSISRESTPNTDWDWGGMTGTGAATNEAGVNSLLSNGFFNGNYEAFSALDDAFSSGGQLDGFTQKYSNILGGGTANGDFIVALGGSNWIFGDKGNDIIGALGDRNRVFSGSGDDIIVAYGGANSVFTESGHDVVVSIGADNQVDTGDGDDFAILVGTNNRLKAGNGDNVAIVAGFKNYLIGGSGVDVYFAFGNQNLIWTGGGDDIVFVLGMQNNFFLGEGNDHVINFGYSSNLVGGAGSDFFRAGGGEMSSYDGGEDDDVLVADVEAAHSEMSGGAGSDTLFLGGTQTTFSGNDDDDMFVITRAVRDVTIEDIDAYDSIALDENIGIDDVWMQRQGDDLLITLDRLNANDPNRYRYDGFDKFGSVKVTGWFSTQFDGIDEGPGLFFDLNHIDGTASELTWDQVKALVDGPYSQFRGEILDSNGLKDNDTGSFLSSINQNSKSEIEAAWNVAASTVLDIDRSEFNKDSDTVRDEVLRAGQDYWARNGDDTLYVTGLTSGGTNRFAGEGGTDSFVISKRSGEAEITDIADDEIIFIHTNFTDQDGGYGTASDEDALQYGDIRLEKSGQDLLVTESASGVSVTVSGWFDRTGVKLVYGYNAYTRQATSINPLSFNALQTFPTGLGGLSTLDEPDINLDQSHLSRGDGVYRAAPTSTNLTYIDAGAGDDTIFLAGENLQVNGGSGANLFIINDDTRSATISGASSSDVITIDVKSSPSNGNSSRWGELTFEKAAGSSGVFNLVISNSGGNMVTLDNWFAAYEDGDVPSMAVFIDTSDTVAAQNQSLNGVVNFQSIYDSLKDTAVGTTVNIDVETVSPAFALQGVPIDVSFNNSDQINNDVTITPQPGQQDSRFYGGSGQDILNVSGTNNRFAGGAGNDTFIIKKESDGSVVSDFGAGDTLKIETGVTDNEDLWFKRDKSDLLVEIDNGSDVSTVTVNDYFLSNQPSVFNSSSMKNADVAQLVQAMALHERGSANDGFWGGLTGAEKVVLQDLFTATP